MLLLLRYESIVTFLNKKSKTNQQLLHQAVKNGQTTIISQTSLFSGPNVKGKVYYIWLLNKYLIYNFEELWVKPTVIRQTIEANSGFHTN